MKTRWAIGTVVASGILIAGLSVFLAGNAFSHCDTTSGPIIPEAKAALEKGDVTPTLKWVKTGNEAEIQTAFANAVAVRAMGPKAQELADQYFLETLVRLHREGEGAPYTGIKDAPVEPIIAMTDKALAEGSADEMIQKISKHMAAVIKEKFTNALAAHKKKDASIEAGREYVEAYVIYTHYVEGIHNAILSAGAHHAEAGTGSAMHKE